MQISTSLLVKDVTLTFGMESQSSGCINASLRRESDIVGVTFKGYEKAVPY
jgi:hypothetical protein